MSRVLCVNHTSQVSGGERSLLLLLRGLPDEHVPVLACPDGPLADAARAAGIPGPPITGTAGSLKLHPLYTTRTVQELSRAAVEVRHACDELGVELVHANSIRAGLVVALARRLGAPPTLAHVRDVLPPGPLSAMTLRTLDASVDAVVANSRYTLAHLPATFRRAATAVVHNPVDLERFDPGAVDAGAFRAELGLGDGARLLTVVAQVTPWKGQDVAIRALAQLRERGHDAHLALVGSAKFVAKETRYDNAAFLRELHALAAALGVERHVAFPGERDDVPAIMAAADVLLMPSWQEPFGRAVIESMAMGTPVVATSVGGTGEIVTHGADGLLAPPREPERWCAAVDRLLRDDALRARIGAAGRERARAFAVERHVAEMLDVYARTASAAGVVPA
ncbi:MAG TPA: glycosyltransferase family 4 protein, partial [Conexibacter sp.]|nr:glycosyltransferase family 4 protein [Conexibacter sp.]